MCTAVHCDIAVLFMSAWVELGVGFWDCNPLNDEDKCNTTDVLAINASIYLALHKLYIDLHEIYIAFIHPHFN